MDRDFEILYGSKPEYLRPNSNLPGRFVYTLTRLTNHADFMDKIRESLEGKYPGFGTTWDWTDYGIPNDFNPVREFVTPYSQFSRAEGMKGSEQVVRGFAGPQAIPMMEGVGQEPNLLPRPTNNVPMVIIQNGAKEVKKARRFGLGGILR